MGKYYVQGFGEYTMYNPDGTIYEEGIECPSSTFELEKSAEFTPETLNIDNDNELLKPENHKNELSLTLDVHQAKEFIPLKENNEKIFRAIYYKLKRIRKKYHSPKRRRAEYVKYMENNHIDVKISIDRYK